ncbi:class I adenylate-forming enzyme family protein [Lachnospira sp.]|jgi:acyl-CoA synthetase (AMP-forming)/AMP-acid ligase II|uniref:class I adenylate-forming enzyme family protein n=1 Tax=Lachnospira sp. TaxID=2049031 RepID=UPI00257AAB4B|nr:class I adenylate-forming enzyme family protein [Lachnospira sp.]
MKLLFEQFIEASNENEDKMAIYCDGESKSYKEMRTFVCRYANYLSSHGVKRGDIIGIPLNNSIESVGLIMAVTALGAGLAPVNPTLNIKDMDIAFKAANVKHIIARKSFYKEVLKENNYFLLDYDGLKLCLDGDVEELEIDNRAAYNQEINKTNKVKIHSFKEVLEMRENLPKLDNITGEETFILTLTSGSTGNPKPILLSQNNKNTRAKAHIEMYKLTKNDKILAATPLYHSLAQRLVIMPLILGATAVILPRFTPKLWLDLVRKLEVTFSIAVSAQLAQVLKELKEAEEKTCPSLRLLVSSSALLDLEVKKELVNFLQCEFHEMYGTSECSTVTDINLKEAGQKLNSVGRPLKGVDIRILSDENEELPLGEIGEIAVKTPLICEGYLNKEDVFKKAMIKGYFKTGDLGKLDTEGFLTFSGRKKEIIITGGVNVYPKDIEDKVIKLEEVLEVAAFPYKDERLGEIVALAVVTEAAEKEITKKIRLFCAKNLADFQQPHKIFILDSLPKNSMGKLVKSKLNDWVKDNKEIEK